MSRGGSASRAGIVLVAVAAMVATMTAPAPAAAASVPAATAAATTDPVTLEHACPEPLPASPFADVAEHDTHARAIGCLVAHGITQGRTATTYDPGASLTRAQAASLLARTIERTDTSLPATPHPFRDVAGTHATAIGQLAAVGIPQGTTPDTFAPGRPLTRGQMASLLVRTLDHLGIATPSGAHRFADVSAGYVHADAIATLVELGITQGRTTSRFDPGSPVTRAQMASFLMRTVDLLVARGLVEVPWQVSDPEPEPEPDPAPATSWRFDPGAVLLAPGGGPVAVDLVGVAADGSPTEQVPETVALTVSGDGSAVSIDREAARLTITPADHAGTVLVAATVDGDEVELPLTVTVAALAEGTATYTDGQILHPPTRTQLAPWLTLDGDPFGQVEASGSLAGDGAPPSADERGLPSADLFDLGPFTPAEVLERTRFDEHDEVSIHPVIVRGSGPAVGQPLLATEDTPVLGVVSPEPPPLTRDGPDGTFTLLAVEAASPADVFDDYVAQLDTDDLVAAGIVDELIEECFASSAAGCAPGAGETLPGGPAAVDRIGSWSRAGGSTSLAAATGSANAASVNDRCDASVSILREWSFTPVVRPRAALDVDVAAGRLIVDLGLDAAVTTSATFGVSGGGTLELTCRLIDQSRTWPIGGPLAAIVSPYVGYSVPLEVEAELRGGPLVDVTLTCHIVHQPRLRAGVDFATGGPVVEVSGDLTPQPTCHDDYETQGDPEALERAGMEVEAGVYGRVEGGLRATGLGWLAAKLVTFVLPGGTPSGGSSSTSMPILFVQAGARIDTTIKSAQVVLGEEAGDARAVASLVAEGVFNGARLESILDGLIAAFTEDGTNPVDLSFLSPTETSLVLAGIRGLIPGELSVDIDGQPRTAPYTLLPGQELTLRGTYDHTDIGGGGTAPPAIASSLWQELDTTSFVRSELLELDSTSTGFSGSTTIDRWACEDDIGEGLDLHVTGLNRFGSADIVGYGGKVELECGEPELSFSPTSVRLTEDAPSATVALTVSNLVTGETVLLDDLPDWLTLEHPFPLGHDAPPDEEQVVEVTVSTDCAQGPEEASHLVGVFTRDIERSADPSADLQVERACGPEDPDDPDDPDDPTDPGGDPGGADGGSGGDPHVWTFDGLSFGFHAEGEFWLTRSTTDRFAIQMATRLLNPQVSSIDQLVIALPGGSDLHYHRGVSSPASGWTLDGAPVAVSSEPVSLPGGHLLVQVPDGADRVVLSDGTVVHVRGFSIVYALLDLAEERRGDLTGILGPADGDPATDGLTADGRDVLSDLDGDWWNDRELLYTEYGPSWEIDEADRLFPGTRREYHAPDFPFGFWNFAEEEIDNARQICIDAGVTTDPSLPQCTMDVLVTGDAAIATEPYPTRELQPLPGTPSFDDVRFVPDDASVRTDTTGVATTVRYVTETTPGTATVLHAPTGSCTWLSYVARSDDHDPVYSSEGCDPFILPTDEPGTWVIDAIHGAQPDDGAGAVEIHATGGLPVGTVDISSSTGPTTVPAGTAAVFTTAASEELTVWRSDDLATCGSSFGVTATIAHRHDDWVGSTTQDAVVSLAGCPSGGSDGASLLVVSTLGSDEVVTEQRTPLTQPIVQPVEFPTTVEVTATEGPGGVAPQLEVDLAADVPVELSVACDGLLVPPGGGGQLLAEVRSADESLVASGVLATGADDHIGCSTLTFVPEASGTYRIALRGLAGNTLPLTLEPGELGSASPSNLAVGGDHACVVDDGQVWCWGRNDFGQLGDGTIADPADPGRPEPAPVIGLEDAVAVSAGATHTCAVRETGHVVCWGQNYGTLGDGSETAVEPTPVTATGLEDAVAVAAGGSHSCALRETGQVTCWGQNGAAAGTGQGGFSSQPTPRDLPEVPDAVAIAAGDDHACAVTGAGELLCWGSNGEGQLGIGSADTDGQAFLPAQVPGLSDLRDVRAGLWTTCATATDGAAWCWGFNGSGNLGDGTTERRTSPTRVTSLVDATAVHPTASHTCATRHQEVAGCWGERWGGQLGDGIVDDDPRPQFGPPVAGPVFVELGVGSGGACGLTADGTVWCWGFDVYGAIGPNAEDVNPRPVLVPYGPAEPG